MRKVRIEDFLSRPAFIRLAMRAGYSRHYAGLLYNQMRQPQIVNGPSAKTEVEITEEIRKQLRWLSGRSFEDNGTKE